MCAPQTTGVTAVTATEINPIRGNTEATAQINAAASNQQTHADGCIVQTPCPPKQSQGQQHNKPPGCLMRMVCSRLCNGMHDTPFQLPCPGLADSHQVGTTFHCDLRQLKTCSNPYTQCMHSLLIDGWMTRAHTIQLAVGHSHTTEACTLSPHCTRMQCICAWPVVL